MKRTLSVARVFGAAAVLGTAASIGFVQSQAARAVSTAPPSSCALGNGVSHVIQITFDNVHFFRDNPNVPSDLEQMPNLLRFIESNGTLLSNNHTPLIAHTSDDSLTNYTGLYGDRQGAGIGNSYEVYNGTGGVDTASAFTSWTAPIDDEKTAPNPGPDALPNMIYSSAVPAVQTQVGGQQAQTPAPWVPFTRAGCDFGAVSTANMVLENVQPDINTVFGATSPEAQQVAADADSFKDQETNDFVGMTVHCAQGSSFCGTATGVKFGGTTAVPTSVADTLPTEPGGYNGFTQLVGHRYIAPQLGAGTPSLQSASGFPVTNAKGNLVDLAGNEIDGQFVNTPGFPGFGPITASQTLAYMADMLEKGVPVTYGYISDLHERKFYPNATPPACTTQGAKSGYALGSGDPCYEFNAQQWDQAFGTFLQRLATDGITPANTEFVFTADEGDHEASANVGRAVTPTCTGTAGTASYTCSYPTGTLGEVEPSIHGLLANQLNDTTPFYMESQGASVYVTGSQPPTVVRQLERDFGAATVSDPYSGNSNQPIADYMASANEEQLLHFVNADPNRTPTFTVFPNPDIFFTIGNTDSPACASGTTAANAAADCTIESSRYAWNHGYYAPEINTTWLGLVGPGVAHKGLDGNAANAGPNSAGANSGQGTVPAAGTNGTWADHTDVRPTLMALTGLKDDYGHDGRVLVEDMTAPPAGTSAPAFLPLAACYKQLNASVGRFGTATLLASTAAMKSGNSSDDSSYANFANQLATLGTQRDVLATSMKVDLEAAEFGTGLPADAVANTQQCLSLLAAADSLAGVSTARSTTLVAEPAIAELVPAISVELPNLIAHLSDPAGPVVGRTVAFTTTTGAPICQAVTDGSGTAACAGSIAAILSLGFGYNATFAGDAIEGPSTAHGPLITLLGVPIL